MHKPNKYVYQWSVFGREGDNETYSSIKAIKSAVSSAATDYARDGIHGWPHKMTGNDAMVYKKQYLAYTSDVSYYRAKANAIEHEWKLVKL